MLTPVRTVPPAETPVDLNWIKQQLRVDHNDHDALLTELIESATDHFDGYSGILGRALVTQTWRSGFGGFPYSLAFPLPLVPVQSIVDIKYFDAFNVEQTLDPAGYSLTSNKYGASVGLVTGYGWPAWSTRDDAVAVTFVAGYGSAAAVPAAIKGAIKLHVEMHYDTDVDQSVWEQRIDALTTPYRVPRI